MSDDYLTQEEALSEIIQSLFTEHGPQINLDSKKLIEDLWNEVDKGLDPEEQEIAVVGLITGCLNGTLTMALRRWGVATAVDILEEITEQYKVYLRKMDDLN